MRHTLPLPRLLLTLALAVVALAAIACGAPAQTQTAAQPTLAAPTLRPDAAPTARPTARPTAKPTTASPAQGPQAPAGMKTIQESQLPREARQTLALIDAGGPFPYRQDGQTFQNREGLLPAKPDGYYREYTVETPGSPDRGARRIITGRGGEVYYTDDHYASFKWVIRT